MKICFPVRAGCPNSGSQPSGRFWNSPGCHRHRQPILSRFRLAASLAKRLTFAHRMHTLPQQAMYKTPYSSIKEITEGIRSKSFSPAEIVEAHLRRIEQLQPKLNAFVHLDAEGASPRGTHSRIFDYAQRKSRPTARCSSHHQELH